MAEYYPLAELEAGDVEALEAAALTIVYNSMLIVRHGMMTKDLLNAGNIEHKADGSLVTPTDHKSEQLASEILADMAPDVRFRGEEGTTRGNGAYELGLDPLDGTRNYVVGAADATVLATIYKPDYSIHGAVIGQPATGRIYSAFNGSSTEGRLINQRPNGIGETLIHVRDVKTWDGDLADKGQIFIDNNQPFERNGRQTMSAEQHMSLRTRIQEIGAGILELGSNGAHQLSVVSGSGKAAASITTARGVWEDTSAGLHIAEHSGGAIQRLVTREGSAIPVGADVLDYDMAIAANNANTLEIVADIITSLPRGN